MIMTGLRTITPLRMPDIKPAKVVGAHMPETRWVPPERLCVEDAYQRNLSERSIRLIRKIVASWDWARFKPPICVEAPDGRLYVVDGQHTAIAAATHPDIAEILVIVVSAPEIKDRAAAFMGHNRDRVSITPAQLYFASVAAGEEVAVAMEEACKRAGVTVLKTVPYQGGWLEGETLAIGAIKRVVENHGVNGGARLLKLLVDAQRAPISALEVKALAAILFDPQRKDMDQVDLATIIRSRSQERWQDDAALVGARTNTLQWKALALLWTRAVASLKAVA